MKRKCSYSLLLLFAFICCCPPITMASPKRVTITLPTFVIHINDIEIENESSKYPIILYQDICYVPMTYYDCRFLGLESIWKSSTGLEISKTGVSWGYQKYPAARLNQSNYTAELYSGPLKVNSKPINNAQEEYPLLVFRDTTYFPLTWRWAVNEFAWDYSFSPDSGLCINSVKNGGSIAATQLSLPIVRRANGEKGAFTMAGNYYYYEGTDGKIYQAPLAAPLEARLVYQLPKDSISSDYVLAGLRTENGKAILNYHMGGTAMGADTLVWLKEDGNYEILDQGYASLKLVSGFTIKVDQSVPPSGNNLQLKRPDDQSYKTVGNPDYLYGWVWKNDPSGQGGSPSSDLYLLDNHIYVLACSKDEPGASSGLYRVNINTNETERLCAEAVISFKIINDTIYFKDQSQSLYSLPLGAKTAQKLAASSVGDYAVLNKSVYYSRTDKQDQVFAIDSGESINPGGKLKTMEVQDGYLLVIFEKSSISPDKMLIMNENGKIIYKTTENVLLLRIDHGKVVYVKDN